MRRHHIYFVLVLFFFSSHTSVFGWQGRMGGMGDPYGLISDASDFFIHPSKIEKGEDTKFYSHFQYTYGDVTDWDYGLNRFLPTGVFDRFRHFNTSGTENSFKANMGSTFSAGPGAMGIFFFYEGKRGDYDGSEQYQTTAALENFLYDLSDDMNQFQLRSIYGFALGDTEMGTELAINSTREEKESWIFDTNGIRGTQNYPWSWAFPHLSTFPFIIPNDSDYVEIEGKLGVQRQWDSSDLVATLKGGYIISGSNNYIYTFEPFVNGGYQSLDLDGAGASTQPAGAIAILGMDKIRKGWFIGAGISILFGQ